jgi:DNA polymerase III subunit gamma/tau
MSYQVTARKWRPMVFEDVVGQSHVTNTLRNALATDRLAHAFIFSGRQGCGKTTTARILAKAVNCLNPKNFDPCNECEVCQEINSGRSMDIIEIDGASTNSVDDVRAIREAVRYTPTRGRKKIYIIDEIHMLSKGAFNALLKTLEEPPPHIIFIFATTEIHKVPATIISRCQRYDFRRISVEDIMSRLRFIAEQEKIAIDDDSLMIIAKKGDGSMRDAQSIFDQVVSFCGTTITAPQVITALNVVDQEFFFRVTDTVSASDTKAGLALVDEVIQNGFDIKEFLSGLSEHFRNLLIAKTSQSSKLIETSEAYRLRYQKDAEHFSEQDLLRLIKLVNDLTSSLRYSSQPRFLLEIGIVQMTKMERSVKIDDVLNRLNELKKKFNSGSATSTGSLMSHSSESTAVSSPSSLSAALDEKTVSYTVAVSRNPFENSEPGSKTSITPSLGAPQTSRSNGDVTLEQIQHEWQKVVDEVRKKRISVGIILEESTPLEIVNDTLRLACGDEFHYSSLKRNLTFLTEAINGAFGSRFRLEPLIRPFSQPHESQQTNQDKQTTNGNSSYTPPPSSQPPQVRASTDEHPLIKTLYREFGAERV